MEKEVRILTQEQLDAYGEWRVTYDNFECFHCGADNFSELQVEWLKANPCPLPSPVKVLTEDEIMKLCIKRYGNYCMDEIDAYAQCLSDLGIK